MFNKYVFNLLLIAPYSMAMGGRLHIDKNNILQLAPAVPREVKEAVDQFFSQKPTMVNVLSGVSYTRILPGTSHAPFSMNFQALSSDDTRLFFEPLKQNLTAAGINVSEGVHGKISMLQNFTLPLNDTWLIKASGLLNRRANILHEMGLNNSDHELPQAELDDFMLHHDGQTFQTLSRMAYWLRLKNCKETAKNPLNHIGLQEKYLVHIPKRPDFAADTNYVVVAQKIQNAQPITKTTLLENPAVVAQVTYAICGASLWDINENNVVAADNKVYFIDTEQPNCWPPSKFGKSSGCGDTNALKRMLKNESLRNLVDTIASTFQQ
jgi:hypothetical protein